MEEEMRDEMKEMNKKIDKMILKNEAEGMINKVQQDFVKEAKRELREARKPLENRTETRDTKSYSEVTKRRKEEAIVVRPNKQQESNQKSHCGERSPQPPGQATEIPLPHGT